MHLYIVWFYTERIAKTNTNKQEMKSEIPAEQCHKFQRPMKTIEKATKESNDRWQ